MKLYDLSGITEKVTKVKIKKNDGFEIVDMVPVKSIASAPSVEVDVAHWEFAPGRKFKCTGCGELTTGDISSGNYVAHFGLFPYPYCPMCGAIMEK